MHRPSLPSRAGGVKADTRKTKLLVAAGYTHTHTCRRRDLFRAVCHQVMFRASAKYKAGAVVRALGKRFIARKR